MTINRGLPTGWTYGSIVDCPGGALVTGSSYRHIPGPDAGGDGALELSVPAGGAAALTIPLSGASMASLTNFTIETQQPAASTGPSMTSYLNILGDLTDGTGQHYRLFHGVQPGITEFNGLDFLADSPIWAEGVGDAEMLLKGSGDYATFLASSFNTSHPATPRSIEYRFDNCNGTATQTLDIDDLIVGIDGTSTLYSLNAPLPPTLTPRPLATGIVSGKTVTPSVTVTDGTSPLSGEQVALLQKAAGATTFTVAATSTTNAAGVATASSLIPKKNTTYEWYFAAADGYAQSVSTPSIVTVAPKVSIFLAKRIVKKGKPLNLSGTVAPKHGGSKIILWRQKGAKPVKLAKTKEKANGFFTFDETLPEGNYQLYVTSQKTATNGAGTSATKAFSVIK